MKRRYLIGVLMLAMVAACASAGEEDAPTSTPTNPPPSDPDRPFVEGEVARVEAERADSP
ncbi:MAG: hypothetical protein ACLFWM_06575 [Actinomycetota bacterium]